MSAGGEAPLAIRHIAADLDAFGIEVEPWEARLLRTLSGVWCSERAVARKHDCPEPLAEAEGTPQDPVKDQFRALFLAMGGRQPIEKGGA